MKFLRQGDRGEILFFLLKIWNNYCCKQKKSNTMKNIGVLCLLFLPFFVFPQQYENLIFEGGGIRGLVYGGVVQVLDENATLEAIQNVAGTSAGAIVALAISLGYSGREVSEIIYNTEFQNFNDGKYVFLGGTYRLNKNFGWYQGDAFENWLGEIIKKKTGNENTTFQELSDMGYKNLYITATSLNFQKYLVLSKETYPDMRIKDAVRCSMSIPLYFEALFLDEKGELHKEQNEQQTYHLVVDGGFITNFPIFIFDSVYVENGSEKRIANPKTLGVRIDTDEQIEYDKTGKGLAPQKIENLNDYLYAFYVFAIENLNRQRLIPEDWDRTISVSSVGIGERVRHLSDAEKDRMIKSGIIATRKFFQEKVK
jgi:NTE family protein